MSAETELTLAGAAMTRERLTRSVPLSLQDAHSDTEVAPPLQQQPTSRLTARQQRRVEALIRREEMRQRRRDRRTANRHANRQRRTVSPDRCYQAFCKVVSILLLPIIILLAVIGVLLFGVFFCMPLLLFLIGLLCMYYCCTKEPVPPRALWRALMAENTNEPPPEAPVTPPGLTLEQIQHLIIKRKCLGVETAATMRAVDETATVPRENWGVNLLEDQASEIKAYWPITADDDPFNVTYYLFTEPLSTSAIKSLQNESDASGSGFSAASDPRALKSATETTASMSPDGSDDCNEEVKDTLDDTDLEAAADHQRHEEWTCSVCTFINEPFMPCCSMCASYPPQPASRSRAALGRPIMDGFFGANGSRSQHDVDDTARPESADAQEPTFLEVCEFFGIDPDEAGPDFLSRIQPTESQVEHPEADPCPAELHGGVCEICLGDYEAGDIVAWSENTRCKHAFHVECISDWLIRRPTCPSCRQDYIEIPQSMKDSAIGNLFTLRQEHAAALEISSAFRIGLNMGPLEGSSSSASSEQDSVNQAIMFDDTEGSSLELGSDDNA